MSSISVSPGAPALERLVRFAGAPAASGALVLLLGGCAAGPAPDASMAAEAACPPLPSAAESSLTAADHVRYLSDDALAGREVGTAGERCTVEYLAARFEALGLEPAGAGGGWTQPFPVRSGSRLTAPGTLAISGSALEAGKAWTPYGFSGSGDARGTLVYIGPGVAVPGQPENELTQLDVTGRVAVVEAAWPGVGGTRAEPHFKATVAQGRGAVAVIVLLPEGEPLPDPATEPFPFVRVPVAAVAGAEADRIRQAARQGMAEARVAASVEPRMVEGHNFAALLPGADPALRGEVIVVGAHHDHLGMGGEGSLSPDRREIHNGADDNASGTAALIEIAEALLAGPRPARSVLFLGFGGEERGLLGSAYWVENPLVPLERTRAMINLDMVGRLEGAELTIFGVATADEWPDVIAAANGAQRPGPLQLNLLPDGFGPSDHAAFYGKGIPVLHLFTGTHADYHRPSDDFATIDGPGIERVSDLAADVVRGLTGTSTLVATVLTPVQSAPEPHGGGAVGDPNTPTTGGYGPYFGSIPDMTPQPFGVRITGVREGAPAALAGLREGDVIVSFAGRETPDLYAFTYALQDHQPGDRVEVVYVRNGERVTTAAVLTERP